jgi:hypothetical protein
MKIILRILVIFEFRQNNHVREMEFNILIPVQKNRVKESEICLR